MAALDLRGCGASDQPPRGYDPATLARDVAGVVRGLGHERAVIVGHDLGGAVGWATAAYARDVVAGLATVSAPTPGVRRLNLRAWAPARTWSRHDGRRVERYLSARTARAGALDAESLGRYRQALAAWPGPQRALAPLRHPDRAVRRTVVRRPAAVDLLTVRGALDPVLTRGAVDRGDRLITGRHTHVELPGVGHLVPEEAPDQLTRVLLGWLSARREL